MKRLLIALATTVALVGPAASADTLPREMLGMWCPTEITTGTFFERSKSKCKSEDSFLALNRDSIEYWEEGCTFTSITPRVATGWFYNRRGRLETEYYKAFEIKAKCSGLAENWNSTIFLSYYPGGNLEHQSFVDNELPGYLFIEETTASTEGDVRRDYNSDPTKSFCGTTYNKKTYYSESQECDIDKDIALNLGKDRYTISYGGEIRGFCRYSSIRTVWDPKIPTATKSAGGPVTYISATCPKGNTNLMLYRSKGMWHIEEVK